MKSTLLVSAGIVAISLLNACIPGGFPKEGPREKMVPGTLKGNVYSNSYFGITVTSPEGWEIQEQPPLKDKQPYEIDLFQACEYPADSGYIDNGDLYIIAERHSSYELINNGGEYLQELKEGLEMLADDDDRISDIVPVTVGGKKFYKMETYSIDTENDVETYQDFYATLIKNYWLTISLTYCDDDQKKALKTALKEIKFK